jgi:hypothetical protein
LQLLLRVVPFVPKWAILPDNKNMVEFGLLWSVASVAIPLPILVFFLKTNGFAVPGNYLSVVIP